MKDELRQWALARRAGHYRRTCPLCSESRKQRKVECLSVTIDHEKVLWRCWHCGDEGAAALQARSQRPVIQNSIPKPTAVKKMASNISGAGVAYLKERGISATTAALFGVTSAQAFFPQLQRVEEGIAFHYKGQKEGAKLRALCEKAHACSRPLKTLYGIDLVDIKEDPNFIITEGEIDAMSLYEAGVMNATSVPNGAQSFGRGDDDKATHGFLWEAREKLNAAAKVIIATDTDEPGLALAEELARRIGKHRCWQVTWPEGCKDANDVLLKHGGDVLAGCIAKATPWPIAGLYEAEKYFPEIDELYDNGFGERVKTGMAALDEIYSVGKGLMTVVTGIPANGKSTLVDQLMVNLARTHGYVFAVCSFENQPAIHMAKLAEMMLQKTFFDDQNGLGVRMSKAELQSTYGFINRHFKFMQQDDGTKSTVDSIIERIKTAVFRWGINGVVIDPYNYIQRDKQSESETQFIDDVLTRLRLLAQAHDLHLWFVAHPTKMTMDAEGHYAPPKGYSISGSAAWYAKADFGLTVHKNPEMPGEVRVINWKTRFSWLGREGEATILYDNAKKVYITDMIADLLPWEPEHAA